LWRRLNRVGIGFAGTDANRLFQIDHEDLAVTDLAGVGRLGYRLDNGLMMAVTSFMKLSPELVDLPQENKPDSSLSAVPGFVTHRRPYLPD
jgi:hypothetical protein